MVDVTSNNIIYQNQFIIIRSDLMNSWLIVGSVIVVAVLYLIYQANQQPSFNPKPKPPPFQKDMTVSELNIYDGVKNPKVLVALKGVIYDVSTSDFYGVGGGYHQFAGHDASINLAKMSHDDQFLDKYQQITLDQEESKVLNDWVQHFENKYLTVGKVVTQTTANTESNL